MVRISGHPGLVKAIAYATWQAMLRPKGSYYQSVGFWDLLSQDAREHPLPSGLEKLFSTAILEFTAKIKY
jgi:hypothetical protein